MSGLRNLLFQGDGAIQRRNADAILQTNDVTSQFGLRLTQEDAVALLNTHSAALKENSRIEIGTGILDKLILTFCDSPFLNDTNYAETLCELVDLFYYMKNDTLDQMTDDDLIDQMKRFFDGSCNGSLELLAGRELDAMARSIRAYGTLQEPEEPDEITTIDDSGDYLIEEDGKWRSVQL